MLVLQDRNNKAGLGLGLASVAVYAASSVFVTGPERTAWWLGGYGLAWALYLVFLLRDRQRDFVASPWLLLAWAVLGRLVLTRGEVWLSDDLWRTRGWMLFSSSGSTGVPRVFRYSQKDRELWSWANARALHAMEIGRASCRESV